MSNDHGQDWHMNMHEFWIAALGVMAGGIITFVTSYWLYVRAGKELREEAKKLREQNNAIFGAVINPQAQRSPQLDPQGNLVGVIAASTATACGKPSAHGVADLPK
jgi:hypothetical protein